MEGRENMSNQIKLSFPHHQIEIWADLLTEKAPITCKAIWEILETPLQVSCKHAMYTGKELSIQLPQERCDTTPLHEVAPENQTCFPAVGDLLFTYMPPYAWNGIPAPIYDLGCFYGQDCRTFFPMGWVPGNRFAAIRQEDLETFALMGAKAIQEGQQTIILQRA